MPNRGIMRPLVLWFASVNGRREYFDRDYTTACRKLKLLQNMVQREAAGGKLVACAAGVW